MLGRAGKYKPAAELAYMGMQKRKTDLKPAEPFNFQSEVGRKLYSKAEPITAAFPSCDLKLPRPTYSSVGAAGSWGHDSSSATFGSLKVNASE